MIFSTEWGSLSFSSGKIDKPLYAVVTINSGVAIATQAVHGFISVVALILVYVLSSRRTGLYRDPKGIANIASLLSDGHRAAVTTRYLFQQLPSFASSYAIYDALKNVAFRLGHFDIYNSDGSFSTVYQLACNAPIGRDLPIIPEHRSFYRNRSDATGWWLTKRVAWLAEIFLWLGQGTIITVIHYAYKILNSGNPTNDTKLNISKVVLTLCVTVGGMMWLSIQRNLQAAENWRQLCTGRSRIDCRIRRERRHGGIP